ncbi:MAG: phosphatidylcholine/phosphatidylserine synthase [Myxococcota bacterium]
MNEINRPIKNQILAWGVHLFTASGAALGLYSIFAIAEGNLPLATVLMLIAQFVDAADGTMARAARVTEYAPQIDGRRLDDIIDYLNFVIVPVFFMWHASSVAHSGWLALPVLASAYGFSRVDAKTEDDFFLGFPSYWNILAIYLWLLGVSPLIGTVWVVALSAGVFLPMKYLYPSKVNPMSLRIALGVGAILWTLALGACALWPESTTPWRLTEISLAYPVWYMILSATRGGWFRGGRVNAG